MSVPNPNPSDPNSILKVLSFNVWGLAFISKDRLPRIKALAHYLASSSFDIVCLQELWIYKDFEIVREEIHRVLPFSRFFHTGALGSGLAIFTRFPIISAQALPYSLSGSPHRAIEGDFFVKKAAANIVVLHPHLGEVEVWNTHMHAAGEHPPDTRQAHRIAQAWQLANAVRGGAAKGRYILVMGDFNSQPYSIPVAILRNHASLHDSYQHAHPRCEDPPPSGEHRRAIDFFGKTVDSTLNSYSAAKPIPQNVLDQGGKRLDYIFYRQPEIARRRPLIWGYRDDEANGDGVSEDAYLEEGKPMPSSLDKAPKLRCVRSEVVLTEMVPGQNFSYSDHFAVFSTFIIDRPKSSTKSTASSSQTRSPTTPQNGNTSFTPLVPLLSEPDSLNDKTVTFAPVDPHNSPGSPRSSTSTTVKSSAVRHAINTLQMYSRIAQRTSTQHLRFFMAAVVCLLGLTVGSAWQPKPWLQPIFTLLGGVCGAGGATMLYTGFVWGRWEQGILTETIEEMELELRVVEMEERGGR